MPRPAQWSLEGTGCGVPLARLAAALAHPLLVALARVRHGGLRAALVLTPALGMVGFESLLPLTRPMAQDSIRSLVAELDEHGQLARRALYLGPILPGLTERIQLEQGYRAAGGSWSLVPDEFPLEPIREPETEQLLVPASLWADLRHELADEFQVMAMVATPCAQNGAQPDWLVVATRNGLVLPSADPDRLRKQLEQGAPHERLQAAEQLAIVGTQEDLALLLDHVRQGESSLRLAALEGVMRLARPDTPAELRSALVALDADLQKRGPERILFRAAKVRMGISSELKKLRQDLERRPRTVLRDPVVTRLLLDEGVASLVGAVAGEQGLSAAMAHQIWRAGGPEQVWPGIRTLFEAPEQEGWAAALALLAVTDGRVVRTPFERKQDLLPMLQQMAQESRDPMLAQEAAQWMAHYHPGVWVAWVPTGARKSEPAPGDS